MHRGAPHGWWSAICKQEVLGFDSCLEVGNGKWRFFRADTRSPAGLQALGTRGRGSRAATSRTAPRPPSLNWYMARTRPGSMTEWVSGVCRLASRDAGLRPAARLARSRCAARFCRKATPNLWSLPVVVFNSLFGRLARRATACPDHLQGVNWMPVDMRGHRSPTLAASPGNTCEFVALDNPKTLLASGQQRDMSLARFE